MTESIEDLVQAEPGKLMIEDLIEKLREKDMKYALKFDNLVTELEEHQKDQKVSFIHSIMIIYSLKTQVNT